MQDVRALQRRPSPGGRPQPLASFGGRLWIGSWDTASLYAVDPLTWSVQAEVAAPGTPFGLAVFRGALSVVVALDDDDRYLFRFDPDRGFDLESKTACPDVTGSHLAADDTTLYLCQQGRRRILALDQSGKVQREIALPARCAGFAFGPGNESFMISGDAELENLQFARLSLRESTAGVEPLASMPFDGRGLTFDGAQWWTSHRDASEIVAFTA